MLPCTLKLGKKRALQCLALVTGYFHLEEAHAIPSHMYSPKVSYRPHLTARYQEGSNEMKYLGPGLMTSMQFCSGFMWGDPYGFVSDSGWCLKSY